MKKATSLSVLSLIILFFYGCAIKNENRISPRTSINQTLNSGAIITISYGQPQIKGRTIGVNLEPNDGKVWRAGADEATVFETSKAIKVNGKELPAGKYSFFTLIKNGEWVLIFNKNWNQWGAYKYKQQDDVLRVSTKSEAGNFTEKMAFTLYTTGQATLLWGNIKVSFNLE